EAAGPAGGPPRLTPGGRAVLDAIEAHTDERAWTGGLAALGEQGVEEVLALLRPSARAVAPAGVLPEAQPTAPARPTERPDRSARTDQLGGRPVMAAISGRLVTGSSPGRRGGRQEPGGRAARSMRSAVSSTVPMATAVPATVSVK